MTISSPDGLWTERGRTLVSCLCPFFILCLDTRSETTHMERPVCRKGVFCIPICPCAGTEPKAGTDLLPWNIDCPQLNLSRPTGSFLYSSTILLIQQIKWEKSDLGCLHYLSVAINYNWQHVNMPSAGVHSRVACLKNYMYHNYHRAFTTMKVLVERQAAQQLQLCSSPLGRPQGRYSLLNFCGLGLFFRWTRRRCCSRNLLSHALFLLRWPQAKLAHVFHSTAILLLPSFLWNTVLREPWKWLLLNQ